MKNFKKKMDNKTTLAVLIISFISVVFSDSVSMSDWTMQTSAKIGSGGEEISRISFNESDWYKVKVPCTVMAGLVQNNVYKDTYFGMNLAKINGSLFDVPWYK